LLQTAGLGDAALLDISALVRAQIDASCPLVETYDESFRDGNEGSPWPSPHR